MLATTSHGKPKWQKLYYGDCGRLLLSYLDIVPRTKDGPLRVLITFLAWIQVQVRARFRTVRSYNGTKFKNQTLREYYDKVGITHQTSIATTTEHNDVVELQNRTLVEVAITMLFFSKLPNNLRDEAVSTACFTQNWSSIHLHYNKTLYELFHKRKTDIKHFHVFRALCYLANDRDDLGKLKLKVDIGIFIGYCKNSKGFRIYNRQTR